MVICKIIVGATDYLCHSEPVRTLAWESVPLQCKTLRRLWRQGMWIATGASALAMTWRDGSAAEKEKDI